MDMKLWPMATPVFINVCEDLVSIVIVEQAGTWKDVIGFGTLDDAVFCEDPVSVVIVEQAGTWEDVTGFVTLDDAGFCEDLISVVIVEQAGTRVETQVLRLLMILGSLRIL